MIAWLTGRLRRKAADWLIIDVAGVGYQVAIPLSTFSRLPEAGDEVSLHIHTHLREDSLSLFGFSTEIEKEVFLLLLGVSGIGPKLALAALSGIAIDDLLAALRSGDDTKLCGISGIGKKTAARLCLELKDKIRQLAPEPSPQAPMSAGGPDRHLEDAVSALVNLGYKKPLAEEVLRRVDQKRPDLRIEELIREALGEMGK